MRDGGGDGFGAGDVQMQRFCGAHRVGQRFSGGDVDVGDPDEGAGASEFLDGSFADAAGAAGDEGMTAVETEGGLDWRYCGVGAGKVMDGHSMEQC